MGSGMRKFVFFLPVFFLCCLSYSIQNSQKLADGILPVDATTFWMIEKYGHPDKIEEFVYDYDPYGKVVRMYYGENTFDFYVSDIYEHNHPQDWKITNDFKRYSELLNVENYSIANIKKIFGDDVLDEYYSNVYDEHTLSYKTNYGVLYFVFKDDVLTIIGWSAGR